MKQFIVIALTAVTLLSLSFAGQLEDDFASPPDSARPGVYWYFMDGNQSRDGMTADLEAMHEAGLRKALFLEVNIGVPRGPVNFMSEQWQDNFAHAVQTADRLGMEIVIGTGPGWCGAGGPWIGPERSMKHLEASVTNVVGPGMFSGRLELAPVRKPAHFAGLSPKLEKDREAWHADVAVLAFPTPEKAGAPDLLELKALYDTQPYSSWKMVPRFVPTAAGYPEPPANATVNPAKVVDLTSRLRADGSLDWEVPPGNWTLMRFVARSTGATTRPAPQPGHGFESDRFNPAAFEYHFDQFHRKLLAKIGPRRPGRGLTALHLDSWESSSQNWSDNLRQEFKKRRGYDPQPFLPSYTGLIVASREQTERFLWDLRQTAQELVIENHAGVIRRLAHDSGLYYSSEFYDMNPASDLDLGAVADVPMCEFWSAKHDAVYSCVEAPAVAHTMGRSVVRAEAFTSPDKHGYGDNPADMKNQTDWAFAIGINDLMFHTYQHQPLGLDAPKPGLAMGQYGVHWQRNQTFWPMVRPYHDYIARCGQMLRQGASVCDILYLTPEGAPHIFLPPEDAMTDSGILRDKKGNGFDVVSPKILIERARVDNGWIAFPGGSSYRVLVLPFVETMTPELVAKIGELIRNGAWVIGRSPVKSPSLVGFPKCDKIVEQLATEIWGVGAVPAQTEVRRLGNGSVIWGGDATAPGSADKLYPSYGSTVELLRQWGIAAIFESSGSLRWHQRRTDDRDIFFVSNREGRTTEVTAIFRTDGSSPELWNPVDGTHRPLSVFSAKGSLVEVPLRLAPQESYFVVFNRRTEVGRQLPNSRNFSEDTTVAILDGPYEVAFDPAWGGPAQPVAFAKLTDWKDHTNLTIKYYSGEAVYRTTFERPGNIRDDDQAFLDLGVVHKLARVKLNGEDLGIVWTPPFRVPVTGKLKPGTNRLEITVVNTWVNRLIGDQQPGDKDARQLRWDNGMLYGQSQNAGRYTFTTSKDYNAKSTLQQSGLLGPVTLQMTSKFDLK